jgi:hypothetical protein
VWYVQCANTDCPCVLYIWRGRGRDNYRICGDVPALGVKSRGQLAHLRDPSGRKFLALTCAGCNSPQKHKKHRAKVIVQTMSCVAFYCDALKGEDFADAEVLNVMLAALHNSDDPVACSVGGGGVKFPP